MKIRSSLGFIYTSDLSEVLLIEKQKPEAHKGLLNGLGGKCDGEEASVDCLVREVKEEANLYVPQADWKPIGELRWQVWEVGMFAAVYKQSKNDARTMEIDRVGWYPVARLPENIVTNLQWLVPLGVDCLSIKSPPYATIKYS